MAEELDKTEFQLADWLQQEHWQLEECILLACGVNPVWKKKPYRLPDGSTFAPVFEREKQELERYKQMQSEGRTNYIKPTLNFYREWEYYLNSDAKNYDGYKVLKKAVENNELAYLRKGDDILIVPQTFLEWAHGQKKPKFHLTKQLSSLVDYSYWSDRGTITIQQLANVVARGKLGRLAPLEEEIAHPLDLQNAPQGCQKFYKQILKDIKSGDLAPLATEGAEVGWNLPSNSVKKYWGKDSNVDTRTDFWKYIEWLVDKLHRDGKYTKPIEVWGRLKELQKTNCDPQKKKEYLHKYDLSRDMTEEPIYRIKGNKLFHFRDDGSDRDPVEMKNVTKEIGQISSRLKKETNAKKPLLE